MTKPLRAQVGYIPWGPRCSCGKVKFLSKRDAKAWAKRFPGERLSPYRCGDFWHLGHLPPAVRAGHLGRETLRKDPA